MSSSDLYVNNPDGIVYYLNMEMVLIKLLKKHPFGVTFEEIRQYVDSIKEFCNTYGINILFFGIYESELDRICKKYPNTFNSANNIYWVNENKLNCFDKQFKMMPLVNFILEDALNDFELSKELSEIFNKNIKKTRTI